MKTMGTILKNINTAIIIIGLALFVSVLGCSKDDGPAQRQAVLSDEKQIISFVFSTADNPLQNNIVATIDEENKAILAIFPPDADGSNLLPEIKVSAAASVDPDTAQNFIQPVAYTVTAENGTTQTYTATVLTPSPQKLALLALVADNPENTLNWDVLGTLNSDLGTLEGVETNDEDEITSLLLDFKTIEILSPEIANLSGLELLSLDGNPLSKLPPEIGQLSALKELSLRKTQLTAIPKEIGLLENLEVLLIEENPIAELPAEIGSLLKLKRLDLEGNLISTLPPEMAFLTDLEFLFLEESKLEILPFSIYLLAVHNNLVILGSYVLLDEISQKDALMSIYSANPGNTLDWKVGSFSEVAFNQNGNITVITMNNKNLIRIPARIRDITSLESLNINGNNIESLPIAISNLSLLTTLTAADNNLNNIPSEFGQLTNLTLLSLTNNPIIGIPQEVCDLQTSNGGMLTLLTDPGEGCE